MKAQGFKLRSGSSTSLGQKESASHDLGASTVPPTAMREMAVRFQEQKVAPWREAYGQSELRSR